MAANVVVSLITFLKGRLLLGIVSVFLPPVGLICSLRLAKPHSMWARRFYKHHPHLMERSHRRFDERDRKWKELKDRFYDLIGGAPSRPRPESQETQVVGGFIAVVRSGLHDSRSSIPASRASLGAGPEGR